MIIQTIIYESFFVGAWRLGQHPKLYLVRIFQRASQTSETLAHVHHLLMCQFMH